MRALIPVGAMLAGLLLAGSCGAPPGPTSLVPSDYRTRMTVVRNCRQTVEHVAPAGHPTNPAITNIRVYVNAESAAAYNANQNPLPPNTLVVKEESNDPDCATPIAWSVMHKEGASYDPTHNNWRYQHVLANGTIDADGPVPGCIGVNSCHSNPNTIDQQGCVPRDYMCTVP